MNQVNSENAVSLDDIARDYGRLVSAVCRRMIMDEEIAGMRRFPSIKAFD